MTTQKQLEAQAATLTDFEGLAETLGLVNQVNQLKARLALAEGLAEVCGDVAERRTLGGHHGELDWLINDAKTALQKWKGMQDD